MVHLKRDISAIDEAERFKKLYQEKGIDAFKFRIGAECGRGLDEWEGRTQDIVQTINKSLDKAVKKLVDANSCYSSDQAIGIGKLLEDNNVSHFEEPVPIGTRANKKLLMLYRLMLQEVNKIVICVFGKIWLIEK